jgi:hypothetical protein
MMGQMCLFGEIGRIRGWDMIDSTQRLVCRRGGGVWSRKL